MIHKLLLYNLECIIWIVLKDIFLHYFYFRVNSFKYFSIYNKYVKIQSLEGVMKCKVILAFRSKISLEKEDSNS